MSAVLTDLAANLRVAASPTAFAAHASGGWWELAPHLELLEREVLLPAAYAAAHPEREDLCRLFTIEMPPRHSKSETTSHYFPAWLLGTYPDMRVLLSSYEAEFAATWGAKVRDTLHDAGREVFGIELREDTKARNRWNIAGHRGGMMTSGVGGPLTGKGANLLVIDDPIKNSQEAASATIREKHMEWYRSTARTRLEPGAVRILIMTRWHEDDLIGQVVREAEAAGRPYRRLRLPALAEEGDELGRAIGEALWPERYDERALEDLRVDVGAYWWAAMFQQRPAPLEGGVFKRQHFRYVALTRDGTGDIVWELHDADGKVRHVPDRACRKLWTVDLAASTKQTADYTVVSAWRITPSRDLLWVDCVRERFEGPDQPPMIHGLYSKWGPGGEVAVEATAYQLTLVQSLRRMGLPVVKLRADGDKVARALTAAARYEGGGIYHLRGAPWLLDAEDEVLAFPNGAHDDMVDTLSYAAIHASGVGGRGEAFSW